MRTENPKGRILFQDFCKKEEERVGEIAGEPEESFLFFTFLVVSFSEVHIMNQ